MYCGISKFLLRHSSLLVLLNFNAKQHFMIISNAISPFQVLWMEVIRSQLALDSCYFSFVHILNKMRLIFVSMLGLCNNEIDNICVDRQWTWTILLLTLLSKLQFYFWMQKVKWNDHITLSMTCQIFEMNLKGWNPLSEIPS